MCIILDTNCASSIVTKSIEARPVLNKITSGSLKIVSGHKVKKELLGCSFSKLYKTLWDAGRIVEYEFDVVEAELKLLRDMDTKSNDQHILALARISGARILFSCDKELHRDFKNVEFINNPRGCVYQNKSHQHLLQEELCSCD